MGRWGRASVGKKMIHPKTYNAFGTYRNMWKAFIVIVHRITQPNPESYSVQC